MDTSINLRRWMKQMEYSGKVPSDDALQKMCAGALGPIFQQICDKVKPRQEIENVRKNIIVNQLKSMGIKNENIERIKLYKEKKNLEKALHEVELRNVEQDINLQQLKAKLAVKYAKIQSKRSNITKLEKEHVLVNAKYSEINKQIEDASKLYQESLILEKNELTAENTEKITETINTTVSTISAILTKNSQEFSRQLNDLKKSMDYSTILVPPSTVKKIFSTQKKNPLTKARKNIFGFDSFLLPSTVKKTSKTSFASNKIDSINSTKDLEKCDEIMMDIEQICWNDAKLKNRVNEIWKFGGKNIYKIIIAMKEGRKEKILEKIADDTINLFSTNSSQIKTDICLGLERLYNIHLANELERRHNENKTNKVLKKIDTQLKSNPSQLLMLDSSEIELESTILQFKEICKKYQQTNPESLDEILLKIQEVQYEMLKINSEIESNLCLLYNSNSWLEKIHGNFPVSFIEHKHEPEYEILNSPARENDLKDFIEYSFQERTQNGLTNWSDNADILELIQTPYLSPVNLLQSHISQNNWLHRLDSLQKQLNTFKLNPIILTVEPPGSTNALTTEDIEKQTRLCQEIDGSLVDIDQELEVWLHLPLNQCIPSETKVDGKEFKEYVTEYEEIFKKL